MKSLDSRGFRTKSVHGAVKPCSHTGAIIPPIYQTSTFIFSDVDQGASRFAGEEDGYIYTRIGNPTLAMLEEQIALLEGGEQGLAFGSGMAAISAVLIGLIKSGDHILCPNGIYGSTFGLLKMLQDKFQVETTYVDMSDTEQILNAVKKNTKVFYIETPINPTMKLVDLEAVSKIAHEVGAIVVVDNTFATPYLQRPLELGADIVIHSATKYLGGHGDIIAGLAVGSKEKMDEIRLTTLKDIGGVLSPYDAWLLLRGMRTLGVRMPLHVANAQKIAAFLEQHPAVAEVFYPGLSTHPHHALARKQMKAPGGIISFRLAGGLEDVRRVLNKVRLCHLTVSLGEVSTLIQHPATMTHSIIPEKERIAMGITDDLIRLSVGLEDVEDIIADLEQALEV